MYTTSLLEKLFFVGCHNIEYSIIYWLLYNVTHELRIKCCCPSNTQTASAPYLGIPNSPKFHDTGISTNHVLRPPHVGKYICASPSIELGGPTLHLFRNHLSNNGSAKVDFIFLIFSTETLGYVKHTKLCCFPQTHIPPLSWDSHAMLTVIDIWDGSYSYWTVFTLVIVLPWLIFSQTTQVVTELHKFQNDTQFCVV